MFIAIVLLPVSAFAIPVNPGMIGDDIDGVDIAIGSLSFAEALANEVTFEDMKHLELSSGYVFTLRF